MPLKINLKKNQKIILNGAVIENTSPRSISFTLMNEASILRDSDVLTPEDACTPASRIYYQVQNIYLFPEKSNEYTGKLEDYITDFENAVASSKPLTYEIRDRIMNEEYYLALRCARKLISYESKVLGHVQKPLTELPESDSSR